MRGSSLEDEQAKGIAQDSRSDRIRSGRALLLRLPTPGSYRRRVQTVRLNDVDIIVVTQRLADGAFVASATRALQTLEQAKPARASSWSPASSVYTR